MRWWRILLWIMLALPALAMAWRLSTGEAVASTIITHRRTFASADDPRAAARPAH